MTEDMARILQASNALAASLRPTDLDATLTGITTTAVRTLPQVDYASITFLSRDGTLETKAPTAEMLLKVDRAQHELEEGPCYHAATEETYVVSHDLIADERFPQFGRVAAEAGLRSQIGLRLYTADRSHGALNLYAAGVGAFEQMTALGPLFSTQAAMAIAYALEVDSLRQALETRTTIGKAVGIVMERYQLSDDRAFAFLTRLSQQRNVKLRLVAEQFLAELGETGDTVA